MELSHSYLESLVCERFRTDERYRQGHIHIIAPTKGTKIIGLHTPEMKMVAKQIICDGSWESILQKFSSHTLLTKEGGLSHEERMIWGLIIDYVEIPLEKRIELITNFLPAIDNWAICDNFCCNSKWAKKSDKEILWNFLKNLFHSKQEWNIRVATILAMCHFLSEEHIERTFHEINSLQLQEGEPYYVRMGIAWLLATALAKNEDTTRNFVLHSNLPNDIITLYIRKARESRITHNVKAL